MNTDQKKLMNIFKLVDFLNPICRTTLVIYKFCYEYIKKFYPFSILPFWINKLGSALETTGIIYYKHQQALNKNFLCEILPGFPLIAFLNLNSGSDLV